MFYVKYNSDEVEVKVELNEDNVFCLCPICGKEVDVDLDSLFATGGDLYGTSVICPECTLKQLYLDKYAQR